MGYEVFIGHENSNGFDLRIAKGKCIQLIEVKTCSKSTRSYRVGAVSERSKHSDMIAMITPKGNIILQPMQDHLKLCSIDGSRRVTRLVRIYDEICS